MIKHGPVDVLVLAFGAPVFEGKILAELKRRTADGTICVIDAMVLLKDDKGLPWRLNPEDLPEDVRTALDYRKGSTLDLFDSEDASTLFEGMVPGSALLAMALEHVWAVDLVNAIVDSGAEVALNYRVPAVVVDEAMASAT